VSVFKVQGAGKLVSQDSSFLAKRDPLHGGFLGDVGGRKQVASSDVNVHTQYTYDARGNRRTIRSANAVINNTQDYTCFTYDKLGRLLTERDPLNYGDDYGAVPPLVELALFEPPTFDPSVLGVVVAVPPVVELPVFEPPVFDPLLLEPPVAGMLLLPFDSVSTWPGKIRLRF
jgi:hypothetical protein